MLAFAVVLGVAVIFGLVLCIYITADNTGH